MADFYQNIIIGLDGVETTVQILRDGASPTNPTPLAVRPIIDYRPINNPRQVIRPLECVLEATIQPSDDISDLFTEEARQFRVTVLRDTENGSSDAGTLTLFTGWLQNDQFTEDFVNNVYSITMRASDGLLELNNAEYTDEGNRLPTGLVSLRKAVINCIAQTGLVGEVNFVAASGADDQYPVQYNVDENFNNYGDYFDLEVDQRVFRSSASVPEKAETILKWILGPANATLFQYLGEYFVIWRPSFSKPFALGEFICRRYNRFGIRQSDRVYQNLIDLGSRVDGFDPFWANENQLITYRASLGSGKWYYDKGDLASIIPNSELETSGSSVVDWTINQGGSVQANPDNTVTIGLGTEQSPALTSSLSLVEYPEGGFIQVEVAIQTPAPSETAQALRLRRLYRQRIQVILETSGTDYYLDSGGIWTTDQRRIPMTASSAPADFSFRFTSTEGTPAPGRLRLVIFPVDDDSGNAKHVQEATLNFAKVGYVEENIQENFRESHTVQQGASNSPVTYEPETTKIGPWALTRYVGSLLQPNGEQTDFGFRSSMQTITLNEDLFEIAVKDALAFESQIARDFSGDIFGYIPYLSVIRINHFPEALYMIGGYSYDVVANTINLVLYEVFYQRITPPPDTNPWYDTLDYIYIPNDSGEVIEPPIRG